jgi:hypothetical protein
MKKHLLGSLFASWALLVLSIAVSAQEPRCTEQGSIRSITKARSGNFETVTLEIVGRLPDSVEVTNADAPIENYSGDNLHMRGPYFKSVSVHIVAWNCRIRENLGSPTRTITGVKQTEQFEGYVSYAIGYTSKKKYVGYTNANGTKTSKVVVKFRR